MKRRKRPKLWIRKHYMMIDGQKVEIDPSKTQPLADLCLLAWVEMVTGEKHMFVNSPGEDLENSTENVAINETAEKIDCPENSGERHKSNKKYI